MKTGNFDWSLHVLLFYHQHVIQKQGQKEKAHQIDDDDGGAYDEDEENNEAQHWNVEY